ASELSPSFPPTAGRRDSAGSSRPAAWSRRLRPPPPQLHLRVLDTVRLSPAPRPPASSLPLSGLDADRNVLDVSFRTVRFFPAHPVSLDPLDVLQAAFAHALGLFPQLAGSIVREDGSVVFSGTGEDAVVLVLAATELTVADVDADKPDSPLLGRLAPGDSDGGPAALALQVTRFTCGGVALGMRVAHALCDGAGSTKFLVAAARFARGLELEAAAEPVGQTGAPGPRNPPRVVTLFDAVLATDDDDILARPVRRGERRRRARAAGEGVPTSATRAWRRSERGSPPTPASSSRPSRFSPPSSGAPR
ncbi:hypothetical protein ZWY2020_014098, partial [Hordeum vulgare]